MFYFFKSKRNVLATLARIWESDHPEAEYIFFYVLVVNQPLTAEPSRQPAEYIVNSLQ